MWKQKRRHETRLARLPAGAAAALSGTKRRRRPPARAGGVDGADLSGPRLDRPEPAAPRLRRRPPRHRRGSRLAARHEDRRGRPRGDARAFAQAAAGHAERHADRQAGGRMRLQLAPNAEQHLRSRVRLANIYPRAALDETLRIASLCTFSLDELRYEYPDEVVPPGHTAASYLRSETYIGAHRRFRDGIPAKVQAQIEHELALIAEMRYEHYFLTVYDIVRFARSQHILCQGRGSAANSAVCYCLGITEVDPAGQPAVRALHLEGAQRAARHRRRLRAPAARRGHPVHLPEVRPHPRRAGGGGDQLPPQERAARQRAALGIDLAIVEKVCKQHHWFDSKADLLNRLAEAGSIRKRRCRSNGPSLAQRLLGFPRHLSQHPGGFVMARGKLSRLVPIENATMAERSVIQWDKDDLEELGLMKVDVLALGMLSMLRRGARAGRPAPRQRVRDAGHPGRRSGHLRHDPRGRYRGRIPDRVARPDEHAAADEAARVLRPRDPGGHRAAGADPGRHGASLPAAARQDWNRWSIRART
jgi:hypothetical protein